MKIAELLEAAMEWMVMLVSGYAEWRSSHAAG
jgi:hypothetical protein